MGAVERKAIDGKGPSVAELGAGREKTKGPLPEACAATTAGLSAIDKTDGEVAGKAKGTEGGNRVDKGGGVGEEEEEEGPEPEAEAVDGTVMGGVGVGAESDSEAEESGKGDSLPI